jgi:3-phenylpropionate/cinnamic acid dioxygenase small subunit
MAGEREAARETGDRAEIRDLLYRYARAIDFRDFELLRRVFTPDAEIHYNFERGARLTFRDALEWLPKALEIFAATQHVISNPLIEVDGDAARSTCYLTSTHVQIRLDGSSAQIVEGGVYSDTHVRTPEGWRIRTRRLDRIYVSGEYLWPEQVHRFARPLAWGERGGAWEGSTAKSR